MGGIFSRKKNDEEKQRKDRVNETDKALLELKAQNDQLVVHKRKLEKLVPQDEEAARKLMKENRPKNLILLALKKKKHHLQLVDQVQGHILQVQELISNVEMQKIQKNITDALANGVGALKEMRKECSADYVATIMEENEEAQDEIREIGRLLGQKGINDDDEDIEAAYAEIEEMLGLAAAAEALEQIPVTPADLPNIKVEITPVEEEPKKERRMEPAME